MPARGERLLFVAEKRAAYHSSAATRDRDRLRQEHLERLGWTFHRIWSQDWFYHREAETERALAAFLAAVAAADQSESRPAPSGAPQRQDAALDPGPDLVVPARRVGPCPVLTRRGSIGEYSLAELTAVVGWIESDTLLRTEDAVGMRAETGGGAVNR